MKAKTVIKTYSPKAFVLLFCLALLLGLFAGVRNTGAVTLGNSTAPEVENEAAGEPDADCEYISEGEDVGPEIYTAPETEAVPFEEMSDETYNKAAAAEALEQMVSLCAMPHTLKQIKEAYDVLILQYDKLMTDDMVATIRYYQNVYDEALSDRMTELETTLTALDDSILSAIAAVLSSPYRDEMITYIDCDNIVKQAEDYTAMDEDLSCLAEEESDLKKQYYALRESEDAQAEDFEQLYLDLIDNRIAQTACRTGYTDYYDYCSREIYYRDYSASDCEALYQWARNVACPAKMKVAEMLNSDACTWDVYLDSKVEQDDVVSRVQPYVSRLSNEAAEIFQQMVDLNLIDMSVSDTKATTGLSAILNSYGVCFIFGSPYENPIDINTLISEFGHCYESCLNMRPDYYFFDCNDLCEMNSQGLEALMLNYADEIYGEDLADTAVLYTLYCFLDSIVNGCVINEFEQKAYAARVDGTLTSSEQLTELFIEVENKYYGETGGDIGDGWYWTSHFFTYPYYYFSYATSATAALSLWSIAQEDWEGAAEIYDELIHMGNEGGFSATLASLGIPDPFTKEGQGKITKILTDYLE